jgi:hypothetical protein
MGYYELIACGIWLIAFVLPFFIIKNIQAKTGVKQKWLAYLIGLFGICIVEFLLLLVLNLANPNLFRYLSK